MRASQLTALLVVPLFTACSGGESNKDPVAEARFQNEKRIGNEDITKKQERDAEFMVTSANQGLFELEISQIAKRKAASPDVKYVAEAVASQHGSMQAELKALAERKSIVLPASLGGDQARQIGELTTLNGTAFDRKYLELLEETHKNGISSFDDMSDDAYDGDIRAFAAKYLPTLKSHREAADKVADTLPK